MKAYVYEYGKHVLKSMPERKLKPNEVRIKMKVAGLNRRDLYIPNRLGPDQEALILGSDGAGVIEEIGENVERVKVGDEVIVNPSLGWKDQTPAPPSQFDILGMPDHGSFAEKLVIHEDQVEAKPGYLSWEEAGVLALSGLTGYRALVTKGQLKKEDTVFIPGAGSGVATFMIQFAKAIGARVITTSRDERKLEAALKIGADLAIHTEEDWNERLKDEKIDLVIDSIGAATFNRSLDLLKAGGSFVLFGATAGDLVNFNLRDFFYGQYQLLGTTMGSREELRDMMAFMETHQIKPVVNHRFRFSEIDRAFDLLEKNDQFGKIAIQIEEA